MPHCFHACYLGPFSLFFFSPVWSQLLNFLSHLRHLAQCHCAPPTSPDLSVIGFFFFFFALLLLRHLRFSHAFNISHWKFLFNHRPCFYSTVQKNTAKSVALKYDNLCHVMFHYIHLKQNVHLSPHRTHTNIICYISVIMLSLKYWILTVIIVVSNM